MDYKEDIIIMKSGNFYVPEKRMIPRNMELCIAMNCLPFDYDPDAKCPEIEKAFYIQWKNDWESIDLLLQFIYYSMKHTHKYKAILCMIGEPDSGKTQILELIRHFIGYEGCQAISLGKMGRPFELYRARNSNLLICDDLHVTPHDLQDGSLIENLKSIPSGVPIRLEKKGGEIISRALPGQIIIAGNEPPKIPQLSNALANRLYFLNFPHVFIRGKDMNTDILNTWLKELPGLMNKVLDAGEKLEKNRGFIEPQSSAEIRSRFEGGSSPIRKFVRLWFDLNMPDDKIKYFTSIGNMKTYYKQYCEEEGINEVSPGQLSDALEAMIEIRKDATNIKLPDAKTGELKWKRVRGWIGIRRKGTSGNPKDEIGKTGEF